jgi:uncharacterized protein (TIGR02246 family)
MTSKIFQRLSCVAVLLLGTQLFHAQSSNAQGSQTMEHTQIQSTIDTMTNAFYAGDINGILATYEPNAVVVGQPGMSVMGTKALGELFKQFVELNPKFTFANHEVIQAGDIALHFNTWKMSGKAPDGTPVEQGGLSVVVLRKQADGRWLMVIDNPFGDQLLHKN